MGRKAHQKGIPRGAFGNRGGNKDPNRIPSAQSQIRQHVPISVKQAKAEVGKLERVRSEQGNLTPAQMERFLQVTAIANHIEPNNMSKAWRIVLRGKKLKTPQDIGKHFSDTAPGLFSHSFQKYLEELLRRNRVYRNFSPEIIEKKIIQFVECNPDSELIDIARVFTYHHGSKTPMPPEKTKLFEIMYKRAFDSRYHSDLI